MSDKKVPQLPKGAGQVRQLGSGLRAKQTDCPSNIRKTCRFDYQPEICKDFYETGYCGYGDNCKFIHDRSLTKSSLVQDKEYEESLKRKAEESEAELKKQQEEEAKEEERKKHEKEKETICPKCKGAYDSERTPMTMKCGDWICCDCAVGCKKCPVCDKATGGVFKAVNRKKR